MTPPRGNQESEERRRPSATTLEGRENQLVALAVDQAEKQLRDGTASAQVLTHYLKLATTREKLEQEQLRRKNRVLEAQAESYDSNKRVEELYSKAMSAFKTYQGQGVEPGED